MGQGHAEMYHPRSERSWGPALTGQEGLHWSPNPDFPDSTYALQPQDAVQDFFQNGYSHSTHLDISKVTARLQSYFSYSFTDAEGVVPTNQLQRHNLHLRATSKITDQLTLDTKVSYVRQVIDNLLAEGSRYDNPLRHLYRLPPNIRTADISAFEYTHQEDLNRQHFWNPGSNGGANPYWTLNRNLNEHAQERLIGFAYLTGQLSPSLNLQLRTGLDRLSSNYDNRYYNDTYIIADEGLYEVGAAKAWEWNSDLLLSYQKKLTQDWEMQAWIGGNLRQTRAVHLLSHTGDALTVPNEFDLSNTQEVSSTQDLEALQSVHSLYALAHIHWRKQIFFDLSARYDWSSVLSPDHASLLYPSVGMSILLSELFQLGENISLLRLRSSWAMAGNTLRSYPRYRILNAIPGGNNGFLETDPVLALEKPKPESTTSLELGAEIGLMDDRIIMDFSFYQAHTRNQLFTIPLPIASGAEDKYVNGGLVRNRGFEAVIHLIPILRNKLKWDFLMTYSRYNNLVMETHPKRTKIRGNIYFWGSYFELEEEEKWGQIYPTFEVKRGPQDQVTILSNGAPDLNVGGTRPIANFHPKWLAGVQNSLTLHNFTLHFLIDIRQGGSLFSMTRQMMASAGVSEETLEGRKGGLIYGVNFFPEERAVLEDGSINNIEIDAETF